MAASSRSFSDSNGTVQMEAYLEDQNTRLTFQQMLALDLGESRPEFVYGTLLVDEVRTITDKKGQPLPVCTVTLEHLNRRDNVIVRYSQSFFGQERAEKAYKAYESYNQSKLMVGLVGIDDTQCRQNPATEHYRATRIYRVSEILPVIGQIRVIRPKSDQEPLSSQPQEKHPESTEQREETDLQKAQREMNREILKSVCGPTERCEFYRFVGIADTNTEAWNLDQIVLIKKKLEEWLKPEGRQARWRAQQVLPIQWARIRGLKSEKEYGEQVYNDLLNSIELDKLFNRYRIPIEQRKLAVPKWNAGMLDCLLRVYEIKRAQNAIHSLSKPTQQSSQ